MESSALMREPSPLPNPRLDTSWNEGRVSDPNARHEPALRHQLRLRAGRNHARDVNGGGGRDTRGMTAVKIFRAGIC